MRCERGACPAVMASAAALGRVVLQAEPCENCERHGCPACDGTGQRLVEVVVEDRPWLDWTPIEVH